MRADVTVYSGGIQLARCLNLLSFSEKLRTILQDAVYTEGLAMALGRFQKAFIQAAPWAVEADTLFVGYRNEILALPLWNQEDLASVDGISGLMPSLKVSNGGSGGSSHGSGQDSGQGSDGGQQQDGGSEQQACGFTSLGDMLSGFSNGNNGASGGNGDESSAYHYQGNDGELHNLDQDQAGPVSERGSNGKTVTRYKDHRTHKYVAKGKTKSSSTGLTDQGGHFLGIWAVQSPKLRAPGWVVASAQVRVAGGDVDAMDFSYGADYRPFFVPVRGGSNQGNESEDSMQRGQDGSSSNAYSGVFALARGLGVDLGPIQSAFNAASQAMEIQH